MGRLLVAFHVYYHDQVPWFIGKMRNINGCEWDLVVTFSEYDETTDRLLREFKPDVRMLHTENAGYDIWPFIQALRSTDLSAYDRVMKLHTKNIEDFRWKANGIRYRGTKWRDTLVDAMLSSADRFRRCYGSFDADPSVGMVCSHELMVDLSRRRPEDMSALTAEAKRIGMSVTKGRFCAGTMFMTRPSCLSRIIDSDLDQNSWGSDTASHRIGTMAHVYERILTISVYDAGYKVMTVASYPFNKVRVGVYRFINKIFKSILNVDRNGEDGRKYLTLLGISIPLS